MYLFLIIQSRLLQHFFLKNSTLFKRQELEYEGTIVYIKQKFPPFSIRKISNFIIYGENFIL